jgi:hypothetical protein
MSEPTGFDVMLGQNAPGGNASLSGWDFIDIYPKSSSMAPEAGEMPNKNKGFIKKLKERINDPDFEKHMIESCLAGHLDNVKDFIANDYNKRDSLAMEAKRKDMENAESFFRPFKGCYTKYKEKMNLCKELRDSPDNPKWKKDADGHCY